MADGGPESLPSANLPVPPPFWRHFTPENRARMAELRQQHNHADLEGRIPDLPPDLRCLQPPEPPASGRYRSFGDEYDINTPLLSLSAMGVEQLYPSPTSLPDDAWPQGRAGGGEEEEEEEAAHEPHAARQTQSQWTRGRAEMIGQVTQSLLLNYLELLGVLASDPSRWQEKYEHIQTLLFNAHHLINEYRPHQARASLMAMMEDQLATSRVEVAGLRRLSATVEQVLTALARESVESEPGPDAAAVGDGGADAEKRSRAVGDHHGALMRALDEELLDHY